MGNGMNARSGRTQQTSPAQTAEPALRRRTGLPPIAASSAGERALGGLQLMAEDCPGVHHTAQLQEMADAAPNRTGLPDALKSGVETLSGQGLDDVRVHYNSAEPAKVGAHAYARGSEIHMAPGQERHLPHEAWHVAQQKQGRVQPTTERGGIAVNDDPGLETEADAMGARAAQMMSADTETLADAPAAPARPVAQGKFELALDGLTPEKLEAILPSYGVTEATDIATVLGKFEQYRDSKLPVVSVPQLVELTLGRSKEEVSAAVKEDLSARSGETEEETSTVTLYHGDTRSPEQITAAGGFFGRDHAPITIEHARVIMQDWDALSAQEKLDRAQAWKAQTKAKHEIVPFVATGAESQKAGHEYKINIPLVFRGKQKGESAFTPKLGCDVWPIGSATVMAIKMHGGEVIVLTGIPAKFIEL